MNRRHLLSDLRPYSCISEPCNAAEQLFETREIWIEHEIIFHHQEWWCDAPHDDEPAVRVFSSKETFTNHLLSDHDCFEEAQVPFLLASGIHPSLFPFLVCPFCNTPDLDLRDVQNLYEIANDTYVHLENSTQLQKHVGVHLRNFSLLALPDPDEENEDAVSDILNVDSEHRRSFVVPSSGSLDSEAASSDFGYDRFEDETFHQSDIIIPDTNEDVQWDSILGWERATVLPEDASLSSIGRKSTPEFSDVHDETRSVTERTRASSELEKAIDELEQNYKKFSGKYILIDDDLESAFQSTNKGEDMRDMARIFVYNVSTTIKTIEKKKGITQGKWTNQVGQFLTKLYPLASVVCSMTATDAEVLPP